MTGNGLHWFRKDLRLHDNPSLRQVVEESSTFRGIFFLEASDVVLNKSSSNRWQFLLQCLTDLDRSLQKFGSRLFVVKGQPSNVLPKLIKKWNITTLSFQYDSDPFAVERDAAIRRQAVLAGVKLIVKPSHSLYDLKRIEKKNDGSILFTFNKFVSLVESLGKPDECVETVEADLFDTCETPVDDNYEEEYNIPSLTDLGLDPENKVVASLWQGGETEALRRLADFQNKLAACQFKKRRAAGSPFPTSSKLSPYLRFGCLSAKLMYHRMTAEYVKVMNQQPPLTAHMPLLWRDFFFFLANKNPNLCSVQNNEMCLKLPWEKNEKYLSSWKMGMTGFPWIDAMMRQLKQEGWIHHFAREAVSCFLTRGCLWINWEEGFKVFEEFLLDEEWSIDAGCWMQNSCSAYFHEKPHWLCPVEVGKALDPEGTYVRKYVPEVCKLPSQYIYEPWKAPKDVQESCGCIVGSDYPPPVKDHKSSKLECLHNMQNLYKELVTAVSQSVGPGINSIHWFRNDLRLHDNPALLDAISGCRVFYGIYIFDPGSAREMQVSGNKWQFLLECLKDLDDSLKKCRSRLYVLRGQPIDILSQLFKEWKITKLTFEVDSEPFGVQRDAAITTLAEELGVEVVQKVSHTLYDVNKVLECNGGTAPTQLKFFESIVRKLGAPSKPVQTVTRGCFSSCVTPVCGNHDDVYGLPTLQELGCNVEDVSSTGMWLGGEKEALRRLNLLEEKILEGDSKGGGEGGCVLTPSKTQLSPYLRFGCVSPRLFYKKLTLAYVKVKAQPPPLSLYRQLVWRDFFFTLATRNPKLDKIDGNPWCIQIPWDGSSEELERWKMGTTGFPWIDALMRQLRQEGWIHHVARQAVGCFLTKGCLWINWEEGFKVFDEFLLDAEWSVNAGNWLWLSCSSFFDGQVPVYCPVSVAKKLDPTGNFIRKYVPEVMYLPEQYIFEPWKTPVEIQKASNCIIGKDYPEPICSYSERRKICLQRLKDVYTNLSKPAPSEDSNSESMDTD